MSEKEQIRCPECQSTKTWKDGLRKIPYGEAQRYLCRDCGFRFSQPQNHFNVFSQFRKRLEPGANLTKGRVRVADFPFKETSNGSSLSGRKDVGSHRITVAGKPLNNFPSYSSSRRISVQQQQTKNSAPTKRRVWMEHEVRTKTAGENLPSREDVKGKILEFAWWMKKQGYSEKSTIPLYVGFIKRLAKKGANMFDPESVKEIIARNWKGSMKNNAVHSYTLFLKMQGLKWEPPRVSVTRKLPFIPTEQEIDALISSCGKKTATFLQTLKETAMRAGEASSLKWINIDVQRQTITLNEPEKNSLSRIFKVSNKLIAMLNALPRTSEYVFGDSCPEYRNATFYKSKKRAARKLQNPRLLRIHFHTLRHWKATTLYHQTKDILYVKQFLGHKRIDNTLLYIQITEAIFKETTDEFTVRVAKASNEIQELLEVGFEYVCEKDGLLFFRKRK